MDLGVAVWLEIGQWCRRFPVEGSFNLQDMHLGQEAALSSWLTAWLFPPGKSAA